MVWTGRFCPVNLSNITNYSVQTLIETTPWKNEGNWCAAARQSWTVAPRQFLAHDSCKSEVNLSNQPLCTTSVTQNTTLEFVLSSLRYWVASISCMSQVEPAKALVKLILACTTRPKVVIHLDSLYMWGLSTAVVKWNSLHQNLQVIRFRSLCTVCTDPRKPVDSLKIRNRIWLRMINIISGSSKFSWNST